MARHTTKAKHTFTISELAAQLDISPRTIRFYEKKGLISPRRTPGNQRVYTPKDRARLKLILRGKRFGFSLDEIAEMNGMPDSPTWQRWNRSAKASITAARNWKKSATA